MIGRILTPQQIKSLPLTKTERDHRSRTRKGLHVFLSYYMTLFKELGDEEQVQVVLMNNAKKSMKTLMLYQLIQQILHISNNIMWSLLKW